MWIDYDAAASGGSESRDFKQYWSESLKATQGFQDQRSWTVKQHSQLKRLLGEFSDEDLKLMVDRWHTKERLGTAVSFGAFYLARYTLFKLVNPQDKDYEW